VQDKLFGHEYSVDNDWAGQIGIEKVETV